MADAPTANQTPLGRWTARAEELADFTEMIDTTGHGIRRCRRSGLDPAGYAGYIGAGYALTGTNRTGSPLRAYLYGTIDSLIAPAWNNDRELVEHAADLEEWLASRARGMDEFLAACRGAVEHAGHLMASSSKQEQTEGRKLAADCEAALEIAAPAREGLRHAITRIQAVPEHLNERYAAAYTTIGRGHRIPHDGRFLTGEHPQTGGR